MLDNARHLYQTFHPALPRALLVQNVEIHPKTELNWTLKCYQSRDWCDYLIWMIFESHFPVGFLDFVIWSPLGESQNFIIVLAHGDSKYWWLRLGFFWSQSNKHCMYNIWCLCVLVGSVFVNIGYCGCHYTRMVPLFLHVRANLRISQLSRDFLLASYCFPAVDIVRIVCMDYIWKKAITVFVRFVTTNMRKFTQFLALGTQASTALSVTMWIYCHKRDSMAFFTCLTDLFTVQYRVLRQSEVKSILISPLLPQ